MDTGGLSSPVDAAAFVETLRGAMGLPKNTAPDKIDLRDRAGRRLRDEIRAAIREMTDRPFEIRVPGSHDGGISNQDLFAVLAAQGRDFLDVNRAMMAHCLRVLDEALLAAGDIPTKSDIRERLSDAAVEWALKRMRGEIRDVRVKALTYEYALRKRKDGYGDNPVGVRTGQLFAALERARIVWT